MAVETGKDLDGASPTEAGRVTESTNDVLLEAQRVVAKWDKFLQEQRERRAQQAAELQEIMDLSGLSAKGVDPSDPAFARIAEDLEFQRQLSLHYGLKLDKATPVDLSKPDVSRWRQRTNALKV